MIGAIGSFTVGEHVRAVQLRDDERRLDDRVGDADVRRTRSAPRAPASRTTARGPRTPTSTQLQGALRGGLRELSGLDGRDPGQDRGQRLARHQEARALHAPAAARRELDRCRSAGDQHGQPVRRGRADVLRQETDSSGTATKCWYPAGVATAACTYNADTLSTFTSTFTDAGLWLSLGAGPVRAATRYFKIGVQMPIAATHGSPGANRVLRADVAHHELTVFPRTRTGNHGATERPTRARRPPRPRPVARTRRYGSSAGSSGRCNRRDLLGLLALTVGPRFLPYQALVVRSG